MIVVYPVIKQEMQLGALLTALYVTYLLTLFPPLNSKLIYAQSWNRVLKRKEHGIKTETAPMCIVR